MSLSHHGLGTFLRMRVFSAMHFSICSAITFISACKPARSCKRAEVSKTVSLMVSKSAISASLYVTMMFIALMKSSLISASVTLGVSHFCNTGSLPDGFAQYLANKLNVTVWAPNYLVWAYPSGRHIVAPRSQYNQKYPDSKIRGGFIPFYPGGKKK